MSSIEENKNEEDTTKEEDSGDAEDNTPARSPDGGYGWVVVASAFFTFCISDGFAFAFGVLYEELLVIFQQSRSATAWIPSLFYGLPLLCGPISGALATKYGCRTAQMAGGLLASFGVLMSAFANSIPLLAFTFGVVTGFGMSMGYVTSLVTVAFYFEKKRALATGIAVSGSGFGTFAFAPLFEFLIQEYEWRGTLIILSALTLNLVVCGALLRPVEYIRVEETKENEENTENKILIKVQDETSKSIHEESVAVEMKPKETLKVKKSVHYAEDGVNTIDEEESPRKTTKIQFKRISFNQKKSSNFRAAKSMPVRRQFSSMKLIRPVARTMSLPTAVTRRLSVQSAPTYRTDIFFHGNLSKFKRMRDRPKSIKAIQFGSVKKPHQIEEKPKRKDSSISEILRPSNRVLRLLQLMFDKEVLKNRLFLFFLLSNFILYFWYDVPYVYIVDYGGELGIEKTKATFIVSIIGILTTVGQITFGYIGDKDVNISFLYGIPLMLAGTSMFIVPFVKSYAAICVCAAAFGLLISVDYALDTILMVEFVGMDKLTSAYGISMMIQGIANTIGPPIAGIVKLKLPCRAKHHNLSLN